MKNKDCFREQRMMFWRYMENLYPIVNNISVKLVGFYRVQIKNIKCADNLPYFFSTGADKN